MDTKALRQKILDLAIRGKLVPQDPNDEPASVLLERIRAEKQQMVKDGKLKPKDIKNDTVIFKGVDNLHYEKFSDGTVKCIEDEIPFDVPDNWEWVRIKTACVINPRNSIDDNTEVSFVPMANIKEGYANKFISDIRVWKKVKKGYTHFADNDIGIAKITPCFENKKSVVFSGLINGYGAGTTELYIVRTISSLVIPEYLLNFFKRDDFITGGVLTFSGDVGQQRVTKDYVANYLFTLPPLNEQQRILNAVHNANFLIESIEKSKDNLIRDIDKTKSKILDLAIRGKLVPQDPNDEPASVLLERIQAEKEELIKQGKMKRDKKDSVIFKGDDNSYYLRSSDNNSYDVAMIFNLPKNWEWCLLGDIFNVSSSKRVLKNEWKSSGVPFYRAREIVKLSINGTVDNDLFISPEHYENLRRNYGVPNAGDLMVTGVGTIGKVYIVKENDVFYYKDASVLCFENIYKAINPRFAKLMLDSSLIQNQIHSKTYGNTVDTITISTAKNYLCVLPPLAEQKRIVDEIEKIFATLDNIANQVA